MPLYKTPLLQHANPLSRRLFCQLTSLSPRDLNPADCLKRHCSELKQRAISRLTGSANASARDLGPVDCLKGHCSEHANLLSEIIFRFAAWVGTQSRAQGFGQLRRWGERCRLAAAKARGKKLGVLVSD
jgi:hypothetical protein